MFTFWHSKPCWSQLLLTALTTTATSRLFLDPILCSGCCHAPHPMAMGSPTPPTLPTLTRSHTRTQTPGIHHMAQWTATIQADDIRHLNTTLHPHQKLNLFMDTPPMTRSVVNRASDRGPRLQSIHNIHQELKRISLCLQ